MTARLLSPGARTLAVNTMAMAAGPIGAALIAPILARTLGPDGRGQMAAILAPLTFADALATVGIPAAIAYYRARGSDATLLVRLALPLLVLSGAVSYGVLFWFAPVVAEQQGLDVAVVRILWTAVIAAIFLTVLRGCRQGEAGWGRINLESALGPVLRVLACGGLFLIGSESAQLVTAVYLGSGIVAGVVLVRLRPVPVVPPEPHPDPTRVELLGYGFRSWTTSLSSVINARVDQLFLAVALPAAALGVYAVSVTVSQLPTILYLAAAPVLFTRVAGGYGWADSARVVRLVSWASLLLAVALALAAGSLVRLVFGAAFLSAVPTIEILLVGSVFAAAATAIGSVLAGRGRPGLVSLTEAGGVVLTVGGMFLLVPPLGAIGAALTVSATQLVLWVVRAAAFTRASGLGVTTLIVPRPSDVRAVLGGGGRA